MGTPNGVTFDLVFESSVVDITNQSPEILAHFVVDRYTHRKHTMRLAARPPDEETKKTNSRLFRVVLTEDLLSQVPSVWGPHGRLVLCASFDIYVYRKFTAATEKYIVDPESSTAQDKLRTRLSLQFLGTFRPTSFKMDEKQSVFRVDSPWYMPTAEASEADSESVARYLLGRAYFTNRRCSASLGTPIIEPLSAFVRERVDGSRVIQSACGLAKTQARELFETKINRETNIAELPNREFATVQTPVGEVPLWLFVLFPVIQNNYDMTLPVCEVESMEQVATTMNTLYEAAKIITRHGRNARQEPKDRQYSRAASEFELNATAQCLPARHLAYIRDSVPTKETKDSKEVTDKRADVWIYPWHSPRPDLQEADCEDSAILTYALCDYWNRVRYKLHANYNMDAATGQLVRRSSPEGDMSYDEKRFAPLAALPHLDQLLTTERQFVTGFAIVTLKPPTAAPDTESQKWTYHAICIKMRQMWLDDLLARSNILRADGRLDGKVKEMFIQEGAPPCGILDASAVHECFWVDKSEPSDYYAGKDANAVPPDTQTYANIRNSWQEVQNANIYGHIRTIVFLRSSLTNSLMAQRDPVPFTQLELTWQGKRGVPFDKVFMSVEAAFSEDFRAVAAPSPPLELYQKCTAEFATRQPLMPLFPRPKNGQWIPDRIYQSESERIAEMLMRDPRDRFGAVVTIDPSYEPTAEQLDREADQAAILSVRHADYSPEFMQAVVAHNPGKKVTAEDWSLLGDIRMKLLYVE